MLSDFPSPARMSFTKPPLPRKTFLNPIPGRVWLKNNQESRIIFLQCRLSASVGSERKKFPCAVHKPYYNSRIYYVPCVGRSSAQRDRAPILRIIKRPGKIPCAEPTLLKGSYFFTWTQRKRKYADQKQTAQLKWKLISSAMHGMAWSQKNTYWLIPLPTPLLSHRSLPVHSLAQQHVGVG